MNKALGFKVSNFSHRPPRGSLVHVALAAALAVTTLAPSASADTDVSGFNSLDVSATAGGDCGYDASGAISTWGRNLVHDVDFSNPPSHQAAEDDLHLMGDVLINYGRQLQGVSTSGTTGIFLPCNMPATFDYQPVSGQNQLTAISDAPKQSLAAPPGAWTTVNIMNFDVHASNGVSCSYDATVTLNYGQYVLRAYSFEEQYIERFVTNQTLHGMGKLLELYGQALLDRTESQGMLTNCLIPVDVQYTVLDGVKYITAVRETGGGL